MINIKTPEEIAAMREGGKILAEILHELALVTKVGMQTQELNLKAETLMAKFDVAPSFKGYRGFPAVICTSINEEVVHAIPGKRVLKDGDIISIDGGVIHKGFHTDAAVTIMLGNVKPEIRTFVKTVQQSQEKAFAAIKPGARVGDIGFAVQQWIESHGYSVVRDFIGHGVGQQLHEEPEVPNCGKKGKGPVLLPGMVIAIEPIINMGSRFVDILADGWTVVTRDGSMACQVEHTIAITPSGYEVLTKYNNNINNIYPQ
ncbi:type I methionyl aminopeptidase [Candidatus Peregrinibacteria bacterium]|nr:type I methionyl aminopeptidase [Candidatus Peregrinibacteria bacterium]